MGGRDRLVVGSLFLFACAWTLALSVPAAEPDSVAGSMIAAGKTYKLLHVSARRQPSMDDKTRTVIVVLVTDNPIPRSVLDDKYRLELTDLAREGKIHGLWVTLGLDQKLTGTGRTYAKEFGGAIITRDEQHSFQPTVFSDNRIEGKLSGGGSFGDDKWSYTATIKTAVSTLK